MEYCEETLRDYIARRNNKLSFAARKRIALQFLYGINYIHREGLLHRDVSLQNVMLKVFSSGAVLVKLSDFGLVKDHASEFTRTKTEMRGTIRDPLLSSFKDYAVLNEIYSLGWAQRSQHEYGSATRPTTAWQPLILVAPEPVIADGSSGRRADSKVLHYPTRIRRRLSFLTFRLTSR